MLSNMRKALDGLSNKELISHKTKSGRISEGAKSYGSNKKEIEEAIKKFFNFDEKLSINDEQVIEQLDSDTLRELISMFDTYEYGGVSVQVNNRIYVIEFNLEEDDCYLKVEDYEDLFNEKGIDPFIYAEPIGTLKKNKKFQQAWRNFKLGGKPKFINESATESNYEKLKQALNKAFGPASLKVTGSVSIESLSDKAFSTLLRLATAKNGSDFFAVDNNGTMIAITFINRDTIRYYRIRTLEEAIDELDGEVDESYFRVEKYRGKDISELSGEIKIYHTETQEDYDALLAELSPQGVRWHHTSLIELEYPDYWETFSDQTCVLVDETRRFPTAIPGSKWGFEKDYPNIPIIKYSAPTAQIEESANSKEINESPSINANISKANLKKLKKVLKEVYGVTEGLDISGTTLELLNKRAMKELIDHISENEEDRVIIESDEHLYVIDYAVYEDGVYFRCTDYQTAWEESRVDPFELANPAGVLATNKALQRAWQSAGIGEEPDLEGIKEGINLDDFDENSRKLLEAILDNQEVVDLDHGAMQVLYFLESFAPQNVFKSLIKAVGTKFSNGGHAHFTAFFDDALCTFSFHVNPSSKTLSIDAYQEDEGKFDIELKQGEVLHLLPARGTGPSADFTIPSNWSYVDSDDRFDLILEKINSL